MPLKNYQLVNVTYQILSALGVEEVVVCAGARNAPLVVALERFAFNVKSYFEERSAAFYSIGRIQITKKPIAILTTSGTAVAELLPAVIEAYYQNLPLIVITADRPKHYRNTGAPQSILQNNIFGPYVQNCFDWDINQIDFNILFDLHKPMHFNLCFDEPLIDFDWKNDFTTSLEINFSVTEKNNLEMKNSISDVYDQRLQKFKKPLIILSQLSDDERKAVYPLLVKYQIPHYAEVLSGLKNDIELNTIQLNVLEPLLSDYLNQNHFDSVIRIGGIPTLRTWRDLESRLKHIPVLNVTSREFGGLSRESYFADSTILQELLNSVQSCALNIVEYKNIIFEKLTEIMSRYQNSEPYFIHWLSRCIFNQPIYIGNSLPIREWDMFSVGVNQQVYANRGANGIDGQLSTYFGWSKKMDSSWAIVGDLTALYDMAAFGLNQDHDPYALKRVVIINNRGGQIFKKVFKHEMFLNQHNIEFSGLAKMWNWSYLCVNHHSQLNAVQEIAKNKTQDHFLIEIQTDQTQSDSVWSELAQICTRFK
ncbi:MAG: 2-succinyl-5-enolpyruvyl-6-hydroxy-3-cyclohexene-1-carboxylic-acid synthase [Pseudobdellovibrio sp.]